MSEDENLRLLVDIVWNHATESTAVPFTKTADMLIAKYRQCYPAPAQQPWMPIETAPKDGTHISVVNVRNQHTPPATVHWFVDPQEGGGWHLSVNQMGEYSEYVWGPPTHWMPLLPGPELTSTDGGGK